MMLLSDSLETGTGGSNSLPSANESLSLGLIRAESVMTMREERSRDGQNGIQLICH
jgi:hypothetical protein